MPAVIGLNNATKGAIAFQAYPYEVELKASGVSKEVRDDQARLQYRWLSGSARE
jgi:hypothetical protein